MKTLSVINIIKLLMFITFHVTSASPIKCGGLNSNMNQYSQNTNGNYGSPFAMNNAALRTRLRSGSQSGGYERGKLGYGYQNKGLGGISRHELYGESQYNNMLTPNKVPSNRLVPMGNYNNGNGAGAGFSGNKIISPAYVNRVELMKNIHGHSSNPLCSLLKNRDSPSSYDMGNLFGSMGHEAIANVETGPFSIYGHGGLSIGKTLTTNKFGQDNFDSLYNDRLKNSGGVIQGFGGDALSRLNSQKPINNLLDFYLCE
ncbi:hypothetical protein PV327_004391 [Microctonus hyperodae]|uniref:Uncharacterized protein n=1 Tax=Microctonus hyperodae TaxID=165561 RepID=A0AA39FCD9_MICHY|nr:hypothetical protein PV327_004391 [Microctonus hyperodae]